VDFGASLLSEIDEIALASSFSLKLAIEAGGVGLDAADPMVDESKINKGRG
jgi:hypothetical protein